MIDGLTRDLAFGEVIVADPRQVRAREIAQDLGGLRSLKREQRDLVAPVLELRVEAVEVS